MGPALERLLASPSARSLVRHALGDNDTFVRLCVSASASASASATTPAHVATAPAHVATHRPALLAAAASSSNPPSRRELSTLTCRRPAHEHVRPHQHSCRHRVLHPRRTPCPRRHSHTNSPHVSDQPHRNHDTYLALLISLYTGAPLFEKIHQGHQPFDVLLYESDVTAPASPDRSRLVDDPHHLHNMDLWLELLRFRERVHGPQGVHAVWDGMMQRHLLLPVVGPVADAIWSIFTNSIFSAPDFLPKLCRHAAHLAHSAATPRPNLYRDLVGPCLRKRPGFADDWDNCLHEYNLVPTDAAASVFDYALKSKNRQMAFKRFKRIYRTTAASGLYRMCMSSILVSTEFRHAILWHNFFVQQNDTPPLDMMSDPMVQHLTDVAAAGYLQPDDVDAARQKYAALQKSRPPVDVYQPILSRENMNALVGDVHGIRQKKIGDAFCARLFATGAFSTDLVIAGLRMLGLQSLGALALKEIAARAQTPSEYMDAVRSLEAAGIEIVDSAFSRILKKFAKENNDAYFRVVAQSDQHPDSYDDTNLQQEIFQSYYKAGRKIESDTTLAILAMSQPKVEQYKLNLLLQAYTNDFDHQKVAQTLTQMRTNRIAVTQYSLRSIFFRFLRPRRPGNRPADLPGYGHDVDFVTNIYLTTLRRGLQFDQRLWRELLRRLGMTERLNALERITVWIASWHWSQRTGVKTSVLSASDRIYPEKSRRINHFVRSRAALAHAFPSSFLRAAISWGFKSAIEPSNNEVELSKFYKLPHMHPVDEATPSNTVTIEKWARGLALVRNLQSYGVSMKDSKIRREVKLRLWILFGPKTSNVKKNRDAQANNKLSLLHYVKHTNEVWGSNFFLLPRGYLEGLDESPAARADLHRTIFNHEFKGKSCLSAEDRELLRGRARQPRQARQRKVEDGEHPVDPASAEEGSSFDRLLREASASSASRKEARRSEKPVDSAPVGLAPSEGESGLERLLREASASSSSKKEARHSRRPVSSAPVEGDSSLDRLSREASGSQKKVQPSKEQVDLASVGSAPTEGESSLDRLLREASASSSSEKKVRPSKKPVDSASIEGDSSLGRLLREASASSASRKEVRPSKKPVGSTPAGAAPSEGESSLDRLLREASAFSGTKK